MRTLVSAGFAVALALILQGCLLTPAGPGDPRGYGHAWWCGTNPPSGYCIVPEAR